MKEGKKRRDSPASQQSGDRSREQANGVKVASVDPRENSGVNGRKREMANGEKAASVDPRENSGANGGKEGREVILEEGKS